MKLPPSVTEASLDYQDGCQQAQTLFWGDHLKASLTKQIGMAFEQVVTDTTKNRPAQVDGTVQIELGLKELQLFIPRHETNTYEATVTLGATATYLNAGGTPIYTKSLRTEAKGNVETDKGHCDVSGLDGLVKQAASLIAQGLKKSLGTATPIRQAAANRGEKRALTATAATQAAPAPASVPGPVALDASASKGPVELSFKAMLRDENQDHVIDGSELVTVDVDVTNLGTTPARGVQVALKGTPELVRMLPNPVSVGDLQPGESKRVKITGHLPPVSAVVQAELILSLEAPGLVAGTVRPKKFLVALRPGKPEMIEVLSVDVDQPPPKTFGGEKKKAVGIAVGIGSFRSTDVPGVKYAAHDAEVMAQYFRVASGVPAKRMRLLVDDQALKDDLVEVFEEWLPQEAEVGGTVLIFFSGRAVVDPNNGAVMLIPHEGAPGQPLRNYSLRRLHTALAKLPIQQAVLLLDVTLIVPPGHDGASGGSPMVDPIWGTSDITDGKVVQMIGVSKTQLTHQYEQGKHGLFTYFLLKGLGGAADKDKNGIVVAGELFEYAQQQVTKTALADFGHEQEPACVPALVPSSKAWSLPLSRIR